MADEGLRGALVLGEVFLDSVESFHQNGKANEGVQGPRCWESVS